MMSVGDGSALVCLDSLTSDEERDALEVELGGAGLKVHSFGFKQLDAFVGNCLALEGASGDVSWVLSQDAALALSEWMDVGVPGELNFAPIDLNRIEGLGGGGVRCCLCEVSC